MFQKGTNDKERKHTAHLHSPLPCELILHWYSMTELHERFIERIPIFTGSPNPHPKSACIGLTMIKASDKIGLVTDQDNNV